MQHDVIRYPVDDSNNTSSSSFVISRGFDEEDIVACYESGVDVSTRSATRDTSNTTRDFDLDNTRQTVNTLNSILDDFSKDGDDDDEEEEDDDDNDDDCGYDEQKNDRSILFDDLQHHHPSNSAAAPTATVSSSSIESRQE